MSTHRKELKKLVILAHEARKHVEGLRDYGEDLHLACGVSSVHLMSMSFKNNIFPTFVSGYFKDKIGCSVPHCWVEYYGYVVDITATQFGSNQKVYVAKANKSYKAYQKINDIKEATEDILEWTNYPTKLRKKVIKYTKLPPMHV